MGLSKTHYDHVVVRDAALKAQVEQKSFLKSKYPFPSKSFAILRTISAKNNWVYTTNEIISQMWDYEGGLQINPKNGNYEGAR